MVRQTTRPALIAHNPQPIRDGLRPYGIHVRTLLLQEDDTLLPAVEPPLIVDLRGQTLRGAARLLIALQHRQRRTGLIPHVLVPRTGRPYQRLINALPSLHAAVIASDDLATLATWLWAPLELAPRQVWVNLEQPAPFAQSHLTPLLAALDTTESLAEAAQQCAIGERTLYKLLQAYCKTGQARRTVAEWQELLARVISSGSNELETSASF